MPLESLFSAQVTQPFLHESFPVQPHEAHDDRLFRHIVFPEDSDDITLRVRAINRSYVTETSVVQKHIQTNLVLEDPNKEMFRVKAVLSVPDHGIDQSHWVTSKGLESQPSSSHNQYRMRGVSKENWKSDWVYSEIRDQENDLVIYNMLHDVLDLLLSVHDDQIDYLMDYIVSDTFAQVIREKLPSFATSLEPEEFQAATIEELLNLVLNRQAASPDERVVTQLGENFLALADELKKEFKETVMASPKEFTDMYRTYKLLDRYSESQKDALNLIMEIFLEDRYEKLAQKTNIEVLLQNDEEMGIYLTSSYEFDIKSELISAVCSASLNDSFVTKLEDAVQLISEPVVVESLIYQQDETVGKFLRLVLMEVYAPLVAADSRLLELEHELFDHHESAPTGSIVEFTTIDDDEERRNMLLFDVIETLFKGDLELEDEYESYLLDKVLKLAIDERKSLLIDYHLEEYMRLFIDRGESFRLSYIDEFKKPSDRMTLSVKELVNASYNKEYHSPKESYRSAFDEAYLLAQKKTERGIHESIRTSTLEKFIHQYESFKKSVDDWMRASLTDKATARSKDVQANSLEEVASGVKDLAEWENLLPDHQVHETSIIHMKDLINLERSKNDSHFKEETHTVPDEMYFNLFKHFLRDPNKYPILENLKQELSHDLGDKFLMDGTDWVQYALGNMGEGWPIGVFRLGVNTLKGEVSSS